MMDWDIQPCGIDYLEGVLALEREVLAHLERPEMLRRNTREMWQECLQAPHLCLGAWPRTGEGTREAMPAAVAVLFVPAEGSAEALAPLLTTVDTQGRRAAHFKICMVHPHWRGHHLQWQLGLLLHEEARRRGYDLLCATAAPCNTASIRSLQRLGYHADSTVKKYGFERLLFYCFN